MEVEYLIEKLGKYLGGINVEKVREIIRDSNVIELECKRIKSLLEKYKEERKSLKSLYRELKSYEITPSDLAKVKREIKAVKRRIKLYREMYRKCSSQVIAGQPRHESGVFL